MRSSDRRGGSPPRKPNGRRRPAFPRFGWVRASCAPKPPAWSSSPFSSFSAGTCANKIFLLPRPSPKSIILSVSKNDFSKPPRTPPLSERQGMEVNNDPFSGKMKCKRCRAYVSDDSNVCPMCGEDLTFLRELLKSVYEEDPKLGEPQP